jgi:hypothetical protein
MLVRTITRGNMITPASTSKLIEAFASQCDTPVLIYIIPHIPRSRSTSTSNCTIWWALVEGLPGFEEAKVHDALWGALCFFVPMWG